jgi:hypothetical protein
MASLTRLLFSISSEDNEIKSTEVFDVTKSQLKASVSALTTTVNPIPNPDPNPTQTPQMSMKEA